MTLYKEFCDFKLCEDEKEFMVGKEEIVSERFDVFKEYIDACINEKVNEKFARVTLEDVTRRINAENVLREMTIEDKCNGAPH